MTHPAGRDFAVIARSSRGYRVRGIRSGTRPPCFSRQNCLLDAGSLA